jgi:DNA-binding response OmpR family regulator
MTVEGARLSKVLFSGDGTEYASVLVEELSAAGLEVRQFERAEELVTAFDDDVSSIVLVSPRIHSARSARLALEQAGGWISRTPMIAALGDAELMSEAATLRFFDDFLVAPAGATELLARVEVVVLKRGGQANMLSAGDLLINMDAHQVYLGGKPVDFTYKEFELLKMIAATPGRAYSREELLRSVWGYDYFGGTRTVDVHIRRIRAKIEGARTYVETVHGFGYRFVSVE